MINKHKIAALLIFLIAAAQLRGQSISVMMSPKPSPYISDWQNKTETVKLIITNPGTSEISVKIKTELYNGSNTLVANTDAAKMPVLIVPPGVNTYDPEDIFPLTAIKYYGNLAQRVSQTGRIPDDDYRICIGLTEPQSGKPIGTSGSVCKTFKLIAYQAPTLVAPKNNATISVSETKSLFFRWSPLMPNYPAEVNYLLQVWEILDGQTGTLAMRTNKPIIEKPYKNTMVQWPIDFNTPENGGNFVWTITPQDAEGRNIVDGLGFSEPFTFTIAPMTIPPVSIQDTVWCHGSGYGLMLKISNNSMQNISNWTVTSSDLSFSATQPISGSPATINAGQTINAGIMPFTAFTSNPATIQVIFTFTGGLQTTITRLINIQNCGSNCCVNHGFQSIKWGNTTYDCGSTIPGSQVAGGNKQILFQAACGTGCTANIKYGIFNASNVMITPVLSANANTLVNISLPNVNGNYCIKAGLFCNGKLCDSCKVCFRVDSMKVDCCKGGMWEMKKIGNTNYATCPINLFDQPCNSSKIFKFKYICNSEGNCNGTIDYVTRKIGGGLVPGSSYFAIPNGTQINFAFPGSSGNYITIVYARCGNQTCDSCVIRYTISCINCCAHSQWTQKKINGNNVNCGNNLPSTLSPGSNLIAHFKYQCNPINLCHPIIKYYIVNSSGSQVGNAVFSYNNGPVSLPVPGVSGEYCLHVIAYCSDTTSPCNSCKVCFVASCNNCDSIKINNIPGTPTNDFRFQGNIQSTGTHQIVKIYAELITFSANPAPPPAPSVSNFEFDGMLSTIGGNPTSMPFSLGGKLSNIAKSNLTTNSNSVNYDLYIKDFQNLIRESVRIKLLIFLDNGSYCEKYISL